jgi:hypothetical protein
MKVYTAVGFGKGPVQKRSGSSSGQNVFLLLYIYTHTCGHARTHTHTPVTGGHKKHRPSHPGWGLHASLATLLCKKKYCLQNLMK